MTKRTSRTGHGFNDDCMTVHDILWSWSESLITYKEADEHLELDADQNVFDVAQDNDIPPPDYSIILAHFDSAFRLVAAIRLGPNPTMRTDVLAAEKKLSALQKAAILGSMERRRRTVDPARAFSEGRIDRDEALAASGLTLPEFLAVLSDEELCMPEEGEVIDHDDDDRDFADSVEHAERRLSRGLLADKTYNRDEPKTVFDILLSYGEGYTSGVEACRRLDIVPEQLHEAVAAARIPVVRRGTVPASISYYRKSELPASKPTLAQQGRTIGTVRRDRKPDDEGFKP